MIGPDEAAAGQVAVKDLRGDSPQTIVARADVVGSVRSLLALDDR